MTTLRWEFELGDKATPAAKRIVQSLEHARAALRGLNAEARGGAVGAVRAVGQSGAASQRAIAQANRQAMSAMKGTQASARELFGVFRSIGGAALGITATAAGIGAAFIGVTASIGRSLAEMVRFREASVTTLGALLRPQGGGREMIARTGAAAFRQTQQIARLTPASERGVIEARQQVAAAGFRGNAERAALSASLDVNALNPNDSTAQQRFLLGLGQMRNAPRLNAQDIRQTAEAANLSQADILRRAAANAGVTQRQGETGQAYQRRIDSARLSGRITGQHGVQAVYQTLQAQTGERLGGFARMQGNSLGGALSNLEESVAGLITGINQLERLPGVRAFGASINATANALNGSSEAGQRLQAAIGPIIDELGQMFGSLFSPQRIEGLFGGIARVLPQVFQALKLFGGAFLQGLTRGLGPLMQPGAFGGIESLVPIIASAAEGLGTLVGLAVQVSGALASIGAFALAIIPQLTSFYEFVRALPSSLFELFAAVPRMFSGLGAMIAQGLTDGLRNAWGGVTEQVGGLASSIVDSAKNALGIRSPSKVFMMLGGHVASGMALGIEGGTGDVQRAVDGLVGPPRGGVGAGLGRSIVIQSLSIEAHGANSSEIIDDIRSQLEELLAGAFDRAALAGGG